MCLITILITRQNENWIKELFLSDFLRVKTWYMTVLVPPEVPWSRSGTWILPQLNKVIKLKLISAMIKYTIQEIIDWVPSFSLLEIAIQKECFLCFIWVLKVSEVDTDPERRFVSFKVTTSNESSLFVALQGIAPENSWLAGAFMKGYKIIRKIKMREMKTK